MAQKRRVLAFDYGASSGRAMLGDFDGTKVPLIYLDSATLIDDVRMPPMAEEIVYMDGDVYVMNESACTKYKFGNLTSGRRVWAYELD